MKLRKTKTILLACLAAACLCVLFLGTLFTAGKTASAETIGADYALGKFEGSNFIYSANLSTKNDQEQAGLVFGADDELTSYFVVAIDAAQNKVILGQSGTEDLLKTADYDFEGMDNIKITLIVNDGTAKIYMDADDVALITQKLPQYEGGRLGTYGNAVSVLSFTDMDTLDGDIFCNGYDVLKVVNLTDGNYKLKESEYSIVGGVLTVSGEYLKTLEANTEYVFRVVTSFTDFNFKITTDFTAVVATPSIEKYYRNNDVTLELSATVTVSKLFIDGKEVEFKQMGDKVVISSTEVGNLSIGKHRVKLYTDKGRPEATINVSEMVETISEPEVESNHMWLWIDVAIFAAAIVGYLGFSIISKRKQK